MSKIVYLLGAGVNKAINTVSTAPKYSPFLLIDFFEVALQMRHGRYSSDKSFDNRLKPMYDYINKYWKKDKKELSTQAFDIEEVFTLLELQLSEAEKNNNLQGIQELNEILYTLTSFLMEVLSDFQEWGVYHSGVLKEFGRILYKEKPVIITFNYDFFIEMALEFASGKNESGVDTSHKFDVTDEELGHSYWNWNRALAYGLKFDEVMLHDAAQGNRQKHIEGERFYSYTSNTLYSDLSILKLHGSLNWFRYLQLTPNSLMQEKVKTAYLQRKQRVILTEVAHPFLAGYFPPHKDQLYIQPLIITPVIHKNVYLDDEEVYGRVFSAIWKKAKESFSQCKKLVVIGYSFSPSDFLTKKLFLESFADNKLEELIIVNPDRSVVRKVKDLCHFQHPTTYADVSQFIHSY